MDCNHMSIKPGNRFRPLGTLNQYCTHIPPPDTAEKSDGMVAWTVVNQHVEAFITFVYPNQANAFIHRGSVIRDINNGSLDPLLAKAFCTVAARFVADGNGHPEGGEHVTAWASDVKRSLMDSSNRFSTTTVAITLLINLHESNSGNYGSSWLLVAMAARVALALNLNTESEWPWPEAELRRRLMWAVFHADSHPSAGIREYITCPLESIQLRLPSNDRHFTLSIPIEAPIFTCDAYVPIDGCDGITSRFIWLMALRSRILS